MLSSNCSQNRFLVLNSSTLFCFDLFSDDVITCFLVTGVCSSVGFQVDFVERRALFCSGDFFHEIQQRLSEENNFLCPQNGNDSLRAFACKSFIACLVTEISLINPCRRHLDDNLISLNQQLCGQRTLKLNVCDHYCWAKDPSLCVGEGNYAPTLKSKRRNVIRIERIATNSR